METVKVARNAMATRFEIVVQGTNPAGLRGAAEEALDEIEKLDARLSLYKASSEIAQVNARAAYEPVRVSAPIFRLLQHAQDLSAATEGTFDLTVGPLVKTWGFMRGSGEMPQEDEIARAMELVGMQRVQLDPGEFTVRFEKPGMMLDCGSLGKGWALDVAAEILRDAGVEHALLHGGTSTGYALGLDQGEKPWKVAVENTPFDPRATDPRPEPLTVLELTDIAYSVSAVWGKSFDKEGKRFGHVLDPRTGRPVQGIDLAAVVLPSATETDALSTALLVGGEAMEIKLRSLRPGIQTFLVRETLT